MNKNFIEKICILLLFLSISFSICYWAMAKYDVYTDLDSSDAGAYIKMSNGQFEGAPRRFRYRFLVPATVSFLNKHLRLETFLSKYYRDIDKKTIQLNFGLVNMCGIAMTAYVFFFYLIRLGFTRWESIAGSFLFLTSFFVVNYYPIPIVDSWSVFFLIWGFYSILANSNIGLFLSFLIGIFTKETTFVLILLVMLQDKHFFTKKLLLFLPAVILYIFYIRHINGLTSDRGLYIFTTIWNFDSTLALIKNSLREFNFYTLIENTQTFMFLWVLFLYGLFKCKKPVFIKRSLWLLSLIIIMAPLVGCASVGRVAFYLFPVIIPVSLLALRKVFEGHEQELSA